MSKFSSIRTPIYASRRRAWPLDDELFARVYASREPFWTRIEEAGRTDKVYFANDRFAIYAVGYPERTWFEHAVSVAELLVFTALLVVALGLGGAAGRGQNGVAYTQW